MDLQARHAIIDLQLAIIKMAGRVGDSRVRHALALVYNSPDLQRHSRAHVRRAMALDRLVHALGDRCREAETR